MRFGEDVRNERRSANIAGRLLCVRAGISRSKLSEIEAGHIEPSAAEKERLRRALQELLKARKEVEIVAQKVGWPL